MTSRSEAIEAYIKLAIEYDYFLQDREEQVRLELAKPITESIDQLEAQHMDALAKLTHPEWEPIFREKLFVARIAKMRVDIAHIQRTTRFR